MRFQHAANLLLGAALVGAHKSAEYSYESTQANRPDISGQTLGEIQWQSPPLNSTLLSHKHHTVSCSSEKKSHRCKYAIDGESDTRWESKKRDSDETPWIMINLKSIHNVSGLTMLPQLDESVKTGQIVDHRVFLSKDSLNWGEPVAYGKWGTNKVTKLAAFDPTPAQYIKFVAVTSPDGNRPGYQGPAAIVNLGIYAANYTLPIEPGKGIWGPTVDLPVIPVGAAQEKNGQIIVWSAWADDQFFASPGGKTLTTTWNPRNKSIEKTIVANTQHDMFCPGMSMDFDGNIIVSGGGDAGRTSIFNGSGWESGPDMRMPRGYHATTTLSDGRIFAIGGSWSGGSKIKKNGEVYNPRKQKWYTRSGAKVDAMLTNDRMGRWRADNHGWLFGWKNNSVFQAGPSAKMNWYTVEGSGDTIPAGKRLNDKDAMSGNAVMFDAVQGKILTFGGQTSYDGSYASKNAYLITLDSPGEKPLVEVAGEGSGGGMNYPRVYHTSVVLPDGKVFTTGGQVWGQPFNESNAQFVPEIYDPKTDTFVPQNSHNFVRVYHSISVLLPDATVLNGGGGLCGNCSANHYDAQVFTPPYLLTANGERRHRPKIVETYDSIGLGEALEISTDSAIESACLVRQGTTTHTVNSDQRRVPLQLKHLGDDNNYRAITPEDPGILLPGWYMLFVLDAEGTPSEAAMIKVKLPQDFVAEYEYEDEEEDQFDMDKESSAVSDGEDCEEMEAEMHGLMGMMTMLAASSSRIWKSWTSALVVQT